MRLRSLIAKFVLGHNFLFKSIQLELGSKVDI